MIIIFTREFAIKKKEKDIEEIIFPHLEIN